MHFTLHLTGSCNLACRYCYVKQNSENMTVQTALDSVKLAAKYAKREKGESVGIVFFGGEPLLCKEVISETVEYAEKFVGERGRLFHFKTTTNGLLLDETFLNYAAKHEIFIAMSHDGIRFANDMNRVHGDGRGTFYELEEKAKLLLSYRPYAPVMMTVSANTVKYYADSVKYLYGLGFRYMICSLDYAADWSENDLRTLRTQYKQLAVFYKNLTLNEEKFYLSPFEVKISSHIRGADACSERCELGKKQISVAPDGKLYPCVQFVGEEEYCIGDVHGGIDEKRRLELYKMNELDKNDCSNCAIKNRCNHHCACLNKQATGSFTEISPVLCAHEQIITPIADLLAEDLYARRCAMFIQKQYNDMFPLISLAEDNEVRKTK